MARAYFFTYVFWNWSRLLITWNVPLLSAVTLIHLASQTVSTLAMKASGELCERARNIIYPLWLIVIGLTIVSLVATIRVRPASLNNYFNYPLSFFVPVGVIATLAAVLLFSRKKQPLKAFAASSLYLFFMLAGACWGLYPTLLPATTGPDRDITLDKAISGPHTLAVGLVWWSFGMALALGYVVFVYKSFRGKIDLQSDEH